MRSLPASTASAVTLFCADTASATPVVDARGVDGDNSVPGAKGTAPTRGGLGEVTASPDDSGRDTADTTCSSSTEPAAPPRIQALPSAHSTLLRPCRHLLSQGGAVAHYRQRVYETPLRREGRLDGDIAHCELRAFS